MAFGGLCLLLRSWRRLCRRGNLDVVPSEKVCNALLGLLLEGHMVTTLVDIFLTIVVALREMCEVGFYGFSILGSTSWSR